MTKDKDREKETEKNKDGHGENISTLSKKIDELGIKLERVQIADYVQLLNNPKRLFFINLFTGLARGIGLALGFTIFGATIIYLLQQLGALNLPIIGDYIAEIVKIVQAQLNVDASFR